MNSLLLRLRDQGNTVLVVEHDPETIAIADHVVDLGPGAGTAGGAVTYEGTVEGLRSSDTVTGRHLDDRAVLKSTVRTSSEALEIRGANSHNLVDVNVDIPLGVLVVVTGVAGSGKSSLLHGSLAGRDGVIAVDQGAIKGSRRSNPATYTKALDRSARPSPRPTTSSRRCSAPTPTVPVPSVKAPASSTPTWASWRAWPPRARCARAGGFRQEVLEYTLGGRNIAEVLAMPVAEAERFFGGGGEGHSDGDATTSAAQKILARLVDVGLGYLRLGQPLPTLSGGERQRLKLATHLGGRGGIFVLDEPTAGLHLADVEHLLGLLDRLVESGRSVIVIEHDQAVMAHADWIIDLGPGAGHDGGRVVFEGTPADLAADQSTLTGRHLAAYLNN
jgi:excinuclease UvrABC ATPase subunit